MYSSFYNIVCNSVSMHLWATNTIQCTIGLSLRFIWTHLRLFDLPPCECWPRGTRSGTPPPDPELELGGEDGRRDWCCCCCCCIGCCADGLWSFADPSSPTQSLRRVDQIVVFSRISQLKGGDCMMDLTEWLSDWLMDWLTDGLIDWLMDWLNKQINIPIGGFLWRSRFAAARRIGRRIRSRPRLRRSETRKWRRQLVVVLLLLLQRWTRHRMRVQRQQKRQSHASVRGNRSGGGRTIGFYPNSLKNWDKTVYVKSG